MSSYDPREMALDAIRGAKPPAYSGLQDFVSSIDLWTNSGDMILDPFGGIGSTGYVAVERGRKFTGFELKESYWKQACANLKNAENLMEQDSLFAETA